MDCSQPQSLHNLENCQWDEENAVVTEIPATNRCAVHACNSTTQEAEAGDCCEFEASRGYLVSSKLTLGYRPELARAGGLALAVCHHRLASDSQ